MLYYAREQGVKTVEEIRELDLSGKGVLHLKSLEVFGKMKGLKTLNISEHPEFMMSEQELQEEE